LRTKKLKITNKVEDLLFEESSRDKKVSAGLDLINWAKIHKEDKKKVSKEKIKPIPFQLFATFSQKKQLKSEYLFNNIVWGRIITYKIFKML